MTKTLKETMKTHGVALAVIFGSTARGEKKDGEDLDIGVLFTNDPTGEDEQGLLDALTGLFPDETLDIAVLNHASPLLNFHVSRDGRVLYEGRKGEFLRFRVKALRQYWDTARFRKFREAYALR